MKTFIAIIMMLFATLTVVRAQNKIDKLVDDYATVGSATFTSVVERDPETRKVQKVVKVLTLGSLHIHSKVKKVFDEEMENGDVVTSSENGNTTIVFTRKYKNDTRIYSLSYNTRTKQNCVVAIIIKYRENN